jgi:hypothetical protein
MSTTTAVSSKIQARQQFNSVLKNVEDQVKSLAHNQGRSTPAELREHQRQIFEALKSAREMFNEKGKRRAPTGDRADNTNRGLCQPILVHSDMKNFVVGAKNMGLSQPYEYEISETPSFADPSQGDKLCSVKCVDDQGNTLYGTASYGKGRPVKPSKTNLSLSEVLKSLRTSGITSSAQLNSMFSIYMIVNNLKVNGSYHVDAHMEKCFSSALTHLEKKGDFDRKNFKHCSLMKIIAYYTKKNLENQPVARVQEWANNCGLSVADFTKTHGMTAEDRKNFFGSDGKVRPEVVKAIDDETAVISRATGIYRVHNTVVAPKKPRVAATKSVAPATAAATTAAATTAAPTMADKVTKRGKKAETASTPAATSTPAPAASTPASTPAPTSTSTASTPAPAKRGKAPPVSVAPGAATPAVSGASKAAGGKKK